MFIVDYYIMHSQLTWNIKQGIVFLTDRMRKDELAAISGPNEFAEFYNRLKQIKEFHRKHPNEVIHFCKLSNYAM